mmetsp:Transcript_6662/g.15263  ORF Transcript_6662/g.15263 Transcript_6662/m.15263 type:complete len:233 (+) Transcript_6662:408-1106(+)
MPLDEAYSTEVFDKIYEKLSSNREFMMNDGVAHHGSGPGSSMRSTIGIRAVLPALIDLLKIKTIVDLPCGDFTYMRSIIKPEGSSFRKQNTSYVGLDISPSLVKALSTLFGEPNKIAFMTFDMSRQILWPADLVVVRDVLFHFDMERGLDVLRNIQKSGSKFLLSTYFPGKTNSPKGFNKGRGFQSFHHINLEAPPYNLSKPLLAIGFDGERANPPRVMGLWRFPLYHGAGF